MPFCFGLRSELLASCNGNEPNVATGAGALRSAAVTCTLVIAAPIGGLGNGNL
jgi:hypothetical protein